MADTDQPQIYLITPPAFELMEFAPKLSAVLDAVEIACLRLTMASQDESRVSQAADTLREIVHARDVAIVIDTHVGLVERLGLDGVHLPDGARNIRSTRKSLGPDAVVGAYAQASKHDGMNAAEAGADYVAFGPVGSTGLGSGEHAPHDLFEWWSEIIETPIVAEGALNVDLVENLAPVTDFLGIGEEIWGDSDPLARLKALISPIV